MSSTIITLQNMHETDSKIGVQRCKEIDIKDEMNKMDFVSKTADVNVGHCCTRRNWLTLIGRPALKTCTEQEGSYIISFC